MHDILPSFSHEKSSIIPILPFLSKKIINSSQQLKNE